MPGYIEDRWLKKRPDKTTGRRERTARWGVGQRYRVKGIPGVKDRSFDTSEDAKTWLSNAKTDSARGEFVDPRDGEIWLRDYIEKHWLPSRTDELSTAESLGYRISAYILPYLGDLPLREIDASALRMWKAKLLKRVSETTAEPVWGHLSTILNAAVDDGRLTKNPCNARRTVKPPKAPKSPAKAWERETADAVRAHLQERYQLAVDLGVGLGLRIGEAFALAEEDVDEPRGVVHIRRQLRWDWHHRPYFCLPKGQKTRDVPLSPNLAKRIRQHKERYPPQTCTLPWRNPEAPATPLEERQRKPITVNLLLSTTHNNQIDANTWNVRSWKPALAKAGVIKIVSSTKKTFAGRGQTEHKFESSRVDMFHVLRHTFASVQLEAGESIVSLSRWLGHSKPNITLEYYAHFMPQAGDRGLGAMDEWLADD